MQARRDDMKFIPHHILNADKQITGVPMLLLWLFFFFFLHVPAERRKHENISRT